VAVLIALAVACGLGLAWRASNGRMRAPRGAAASPAADTAEPNQPAGDAEPLTEQPAGQRLTPAEIGQPLGERATLLQFSSAFCAPCRATRRILADVAGLTEGVAHVEIDAESHLDLVRELGILRTPTVLVLAGDGRIVRRASGQPRKADVIGALGAAIGDVDGRSAASTSSAGTSSASTSSASTDVPANSYSTGLESS
jgi:thiol-disulfide isomerase/thioredoxin